MFHDVLDLIDRQFAFLEQQKRAAFFFEVRRSMELLVGDPRIRLLLAELRDEGDALIENHRTAELRFVERAVALRDRLVEAAPDLDDSKSPRPGPHQTSFEWLFTLAGWDAIAREEAYPPGTDSSDGDYSGRTSFLTERLQIKIRKAQWPPAGDPTGEAPARPELAPLADELATLRGEHQRSSYDFKYQLVASPGTALLAVENLVRLLNPDPLLYTRSQDWLRGRVLSDSTHLAVRVRDLFAASQKIKDQYLAHKTQFLPTLQRLHQGLRLKVGTARSLRRLLDRFRLRCERHDRARLNKLAEEAAPDKKERVLTDELARWLFDQGLNPLSEATIADLRPDLLDPHADLYVEAKQYEKRGGIRKAVLGGMKQVYVTAARVRGGNIDLTEAFLVVFRRGGPTVDLPRQLHANGITTFLMAIDIVPASETGSREQDLPMRFTEDVLMPESVEAYSADGPSES
jgi:hypothetical protein